MGTTGTSHILRVTLTDPLTGAPEKTTELKLTLVPPDGSAREEFDQSEGIEEVAGEPAARYYKAFTPAISGLWHYKWTVNGELAAEGSFEVESAFDEGGEPDLRDVRVLVPRARRAMEGPWGEPLGKGQLTESVVYNMIADACGNIKMLAGGWWHQQIEVKSRDPLRGFPTEWRTTKQLSEYESAIICSQAALEYFRFVFLDLKVQETLRNEGTEWSYSRSPNVIRNYLEQLKDEREKAVAGFRVNVPVLDRFASNIRIRDQATVAVLEWWDINSPGITGGGLPGGQEATSIPWFPGPAGEGGP